MKLKTMPDAVNKLEEIMDYEDSYFLMGIVLGNYFSEVKISFN
jgi:hypothetical protein|tara:strand:- start:60 stop:188 length:129 start_codon:yes stop_codon:yes gene_type:complete